MVNQNKNSSTFSNITKNVSTFILKLRHGVPITLGSLKDKTFTDTVFEGDLTQLKDETISNLNQTQAWVNEPKT